MLASAGRLHQAILPLKLGDHEMQTQTNTASHAADRIEITPEMIEVGVEIAWGSPLDLPTDKNLGEMVDRIFRAMTRARCLSRP
jgi:hypothetical protein